MKWCIQSNDAVIHLNIMYNFTDCVANGCIQQWLCHFRTLCYRIINLLGISLAFGSCAIFYSLNGTFWYGILMDNTRISEKLMLRKLLTNRIKYWFERRKKINFKIFHNSIKNTTKKIESWIPSGKLIIQKC